MSIDKVKIFDIYCDSCQVIVRVEWKEHGTPPLPDGWGTVCQGSYSWDYCPLCVAERIRDGVKVRVAGLQEVSWMTFDIGSAGHPAGNWSLVMADAFALAMAVATGLINIYRADHSRKPYRCLTRVTLLQFVAGVAITRRLTVD
jgi:hypothetical protein